jgi:peroxiredoxin
VRLSKKPLNNWKFEYLIVYEPSGQVCVFDKDARLMTTPSPVASETCNAFEQARDLDGSMSDRLNAFADVVRQKNPSSAAIVDRMVGRLRKHGAGDAAPKPGETMPPFMLPDVNGQLVRLADLLKQGPAVVTFHRGHWCPYCRISINTLAKAQPRIDRLGATMVAVVPERGPFTNELKFDSDVPFPILSDMDNGYSMSLNLAIWVGAEMEEYMTSLGNSLPKFQGNDSWILPIPATFVVGTDGRIMARFVDPDYRKRMAIEDVIAALQ